MANMATPEARIRQRVARAVADRRTGEVLWRVRSADGGVDVVHGALDRPFFLASATKLFVTAILAQLRSSGRLDWDSPIADHLPRVDLHGLAVEDAQDVSAAITVREVMAHTAGLADYFEGRRPDGPTTLRRVIATDMAWDVEDVVGWSRTMRPARRRRGHYSDTGYQLLGALIENVEEQPFADVVRTRICEPLGLSGTYIFGSEHLDRFDDIAPIRNGPGVLRAPLMMSSVGADGGGVSTLRDATAFLEAFFEGRLFHRELLGEIAVGWHRIFPPLQYGTGIMRFTLPPVLTGLRRVDFVGHSGASGVVVYREQRTGVIVVGTVNQIQDRQLPYRLMIRSAADAAAG